MSACLFRRVAILCLVLPCIAVQADGATEFPGPRPFYKNKGIPGIARDLHRAATGVRILHIGAHPDDEDSALLAYLSLGLGARVTYLSLTRGEGGQNLIGTEFGRDLGIVRTEELLASRRIDRASQLFGRMIDFGFSKSPEECFEKWGRENIVEDIVRAIRHVRPHIVISRFQGNAGDGHGQHQASGIAAREAIAAAADPERFPHLLELGLEPWEIQKSYSMALRDISNATLTIDTSTYDPWSGHALVALGAHGRSQHRSQDMGTLELERRRASYLIREIPAHDPDHPERDLFEGLRLESGTTSVETSGPITARVPETPQAIPTAKSLATLLSRYRAGGSIIAEVEADIEHALAATLGIRLEAFSDAPSVAPGASMTISCTAHTPGSLVNIGLDAMRWSLATSDDLQIVPMSSGGRPQADPRNTTFKVACSPDAAPTIPYYLRESADGLVYRWPAATPVGFPFEAPLAIATFEASYSGVSFSLSVPVQHRRADPAFGEIRSLFAIAPRASVSFAPASIVLTPGVESARVEIAIDNLSSEDFTGDLEIFFASKPESVAASYSVQIPAGKRVTRSLEIDANALPDERGTFKLAARWRSDADSSLPAWHSPRLDYRHIESRFLTKHAEANVYRMDVELPEGISIGYVEGSGDTVGELLAQLGADVTMLDEAALNAADLSRFDSIVTGVRAWEVRDDLVANNERVLDYVRGGGTLVVQYNKYALSRRNVVPFSFQYSVPHDRVTVEDAPVTILDPLHPIFNYPNKITDADFEGWVQERGLYFWNQWDEALVPLLECNDPGEEPKRGGLLVAELGEGKYVYTGYAFFRQLPAGVEGAARLFANLVSLGRAPSAP